MKKVEIELTNLKDLLRWLIYREEWEEEIEVADQDRITGRWSIFAYKDQIFVGVVTGLDNDEILKQFPELSQLPVSLPEDEELPEELKDLLYKPNVFYFGPFGIEYDNLV
ncbi:MAG: hypothetical protein ACE5JP_14625 [Candidatus Bipolaricaulia bacterium]